ncbi:S41 family peptidase [Ulvibacterium marinum]|uniref:S41 family peptidase n=1 Tax=Ulvibacterium marinum TaxID=2419782 RepID=UPI002494045C|nr:S41 family peptidase [Ulvibacterium marinum]
MSIFKKNFLTIGMMAFLNLAFSQSQDETTSLSQKYSPEELKLDLFQLRTVLENVHPGLYRFESKEVWDSRFDSLTSKLKDSMSHIDYYRILTRLSAQVRCGHTSIGVSSEYNDKIFTGSKNFPFMVRVVEGKLYTYHNLSDNTSIPDGSELLSINGRPANEIVELFYDTVRADGYIETARYRTLGKYFSYYYATLIGYPDSFQLRYVAPGSKKEKQAMAMAKKDMEKGSLHWERYDSKIAPSVLMKSPMAFLVNEKADYAILKVDRFFTRGNEPKNLFEKTYDSLFTLISKKNINNLIIDLRNNGGGTDRLTSLLYSYLSEKPFKWNRRMRVKNLNYHGYTTDYSYNVYQYAQDEVGDIWVTNGEELFMPHKVSSPSFRGRVVVLVNGLTFSAGSILASYIKSAGRGKIVGEESGGYSNGVTGGRTVSFKLKHTGIYFSIPPLQTFFELESQDDNRGVFPDHPISPTISDIVSGRDLVLDFAIRSFRE